MTRCSLQLLHVSLIYYIICLKRHRPTEEDLQNLQNNCPFIRCAQGMANVRAYADNTRQTMLWEKIANIIQTAPLWIHLLEEDTTCHDLKYTDTVPTFKCVASLYKEPTTQGFMEVHKILKRNCFKEFRHRLDVTFGIIIDSTTSLQRIYKDSIKERVRQISPRKRSRTLVHERWNRTSRKVSEMKAKASQKKIWRSQSATKLKQI